MCHAENIAIFCRHFYDEHLAVNNVVSLFHLVEWLSHDFERVHFLMYFYMEQDGQDFHIYLLEREIMTGLRFENRICVLYKRRQFSKTKEKPIQ